MKKILLFACAVAAIACAKEAPVQENTPVDENKTEMITVTFTASVNETKATVSDAGAFTWSATDRIAVYDEKTQKFYPFDLTSGAGANTATFTGQFNAADYKFTKAYYPGDYLVNLGATGVDPDVVTIPFSATHSTAGANGLIPLVGEVTDGGTLSFDYLTAVVKVSVDRIPRNTQYAVLKATNNIAGTFDVDSKTITSGSKEIALNIYGVSGPQTFVFPVPAGSNAVTFELRDDLNGAALFTTGSDKAKTVTFKAPSLYYNSVTVPVSIYVRNVSNWDNFQGYYYTTTGSSSSNSTWGTDALGSETFGYLSYNYTRITLPSAETGKVGNVVFHNYKSSDESPVERVQIENITLDNDYYFTIWDDFSYRVYVCDGLSWDGGNLRAWKDGWECFTGVKDGVGPTNNGTATLMLENYNNYTFKYWNGIDSNDTFYYQYYKSDNSEMTNSYGISRPKGNNNNGQDIVFNAYWDGSSCKLNLIGTGYVATYTVD